MGVGDWAQIASGAGALAAVIVALFGPQLRRWIVRPRLDLAIENAAGVEGGDWVGVPHMSALVPARWYHLRVSNPHRWSPVTAVCVFVLKIEVPGSGDQPWVGEVPIDWRFPDQVGKFLDLGFPRDCDLCAAADDDKLRLKPAIPWGIPEEFLTHERPVHLKLTLQARGLEADSARLNIKLDWEAGRPLVLSSAGRAR